MAIFSAPTTITPFSGEKLSSPIVLHYDSDKMVLSSLMPQPEDDTKSYFEYELSKNAKGRPITGVAYVDVSVDEIITAISPSSGPLISWVAPVSPEVIYISSVGTINRTGSVILSSVPDSVWTYANVNKGTATDCSVVFTPDLNPIASQTLSIQRPASTFLSGVITVDFVATADGAATITPLTYVIRPQATFSPTTKRSDDMPPASSYFWTVTTNIPCDLEIINFDAGVTNATTNTFGPYVGGNNPFGGTAGDATFDVKITSTADPLCTITVTGFVLVCA